jgi:hypothetical protein
MKKRTFNCCGLVLRPLGLLPRQRPLPPHVNRKGNTVTNSSSSGTEVRNAGKYISTLPYAFLDSG